MPSMIRRMRTRLPTYLSTGLGAFVAIANTPRDRWFPKQNEEGLCLGADTVKPCSAGGTRFGLFEQCADGCSQAKHNANCAAGLSTAGFRPPLSVRIKQVTPAMFACRSCG